MPYKGKFITLEGCEGVGKSTQTGLLKEYFTRCGVAAVFTREPGGSAVAEALRQIILSPQNKIDALTELLLYAAARREHVINVIIPALNEGKIVVCDRFTDSTTAYQGYGRGLDLSLVEYLNKTAIGDLKIDLTLFFDLSPDNGFLRKGGADRTDRMDSESADFHRRVYGGFKALAGKEKRIASIDADANAKQVFERVLAVLTKRKIIDPSGN